MKHPPSGAPLPDSTKTFRAKQGGDISSCPTLKVAGAFLPRQPRLWVDKMIDLQQADPRSRRAHRTKAGVTAGKGDKEGGFQRVGRSQTGLPGFTGLGIL